MLGEITHERPLTRLAEARHPVLHVGEEAFPRLLPVVADVDAGSELCGDARAGRRGDRLAQLGVVDVLASAPATV